EDDAELIVQLVEKCGQVDGGWRGLRVLHDQSSPLGQRLFPVRLRLPSAARRVGEDSDRSTGGSDVLDFAAGDPVVDGAAADADEFSGARDRDGAAFQHRCYVSAGSSADFKD